MFQSTRNAYTVSLTNVNIEGIGRKFVEYMQLENDRYQ